VKVKRDLQDFLPKEKQKAKDIEREKKGRNTKVAFIWLFQKGRKGQRDKWDKEKNKDP